VLIEWLGLVNGGVAGLRAVPFARLQCLEGLLGFAGQGYGEALLQSILNLHDRADLIGVRGIDLAEILPEQYEGLMERLARLNQFEPLDIEGQTPDPFPPWSSGDYYTDLLGDLTHSLGSFEQAVQAANTLTLQEVQCMLKRLGDLGKGPEARRKDGLKAWFWKEAASNSQLKDEIEKALNED
jgi:hypothetical protein